MNGFSEATPQEPAPARVDLPRLLARAAWRSFPWVLLGVLAGALVGLALALARPNLYRSSAKLSLRIGAREQLGSEAWLELDAPHVPVPTLGDELQLLGDTTLFARVAGELGPARVLQQADPAREDDARTPAAIRGMHALQARLQRLLPGPPLPPAEELRLATVLLQASTLVTPEPGSSVINVSHTATSAERAQEVVQALLVTFIARHRERYALTSVLERSRARLEEARLARDATATAYVEHVGRGGLTELEAQLPRVETELGAVESELFDARLRQEELNHLRTALARRLAGIPPEIESRRAAVMIPNEEYETQLGLKRMLLAQKQDLRILQRGSEESRRRERELERQIARVDQELATTPRTIPQGAEMQENLGHAAMEARILDLEVEQEALPARLTLLTARLDEKRARASELQRQLLAATMARHDLEAARDSAEALHGRRRERLAELEALASMDASDEANLRVLQSATLERDKIGPARARLVLAGVAAGLLLALALAVARQHLERRLRHPEDLHRLEGLLFLGTIPHLPSLRHLTRLVPRGSA